MSEEETRVEQVTSAGNAWIICRSKSHIGRIYYFNTLTGEAAWNLSDAEMERARKRTKSLSIQDQLKIPEPKEPPTDLPPTSSVSRNNFAILNQNYRSQDLTFPAHAPNSRVFTEQITPTQQRFAISPFIITNPINPLMPIAVNTAPAYNTNVWAVPPGQQIFFTPTVAPIVKQDQVPNNIYYHQGSSQATPKHKGFQKMRRKSFDASYEQGFDKKQDYEYIGQNKKQGFDLREKLSALKLRKKSSNTYANDDEREFRSRNNNQIYDHQDAHSSGNIEEENPIEENQGQDEEQNIEGNEQSNTDSDWLEEILMSKDGKILLNVTNLKKLAKPDMDPDCWYIAIDRDVIMNHFNFLSLLCDSDEDCYLMVPQQVLAELQVAKDGPPRAAAAARRALDFVTHHLDAGYVVIGDANYKESDTRCDYLLNCCATLLEQKNHVVLLSNNDGFQFRKKTSNVPVFSVKELKQFLARPTPKPLSEITVESPKVHSKAPKLDRLKPPPCYHNVNNKIKVTINKDRKVVQETGIELDDLKEDPIPQIPLSQSSDDSLKRNTQVTQETMLSQSSEGSMKKHTSEIGVQTDALVANIEVTIGNSSQVSKTTAYITPEESLNSNDGQTQLSQKDVNVNWSPKVPLRKEIRLNRCTKAIPTSTPSSEKKTFKWRRKRNLSENNTKCNTTNTSRNDEHEAVSDKLVHNFNEGEKHQISDDSLMSESSSFRNKNITNEKLTVEETSTSGIISNSTSNVDSESECGNLSFLKYSFTRPRPRKKVVFEVKDKEMENTLRIKIDEWVSRFSQIMEEVMTQILRHDQRFLNEVVYKYHGGGPWTTLEALDCILIKYKNNSIVVDAARKLTNTLSKINDSSGCIKVSLQPSDFMEMYSNGVYVVETLKSVLGNCEDLNIASQSLSELLNDIDNPNLDCSHAENFMVYIPPDVHSETLTESAEESLVNCNNTLSPSKRSEIKVPTTPPLTRQSANSSKKSSPANSRVLRSSSRNRERTDDETSVASSLAPTRNTRSKSDLNACPADNEKENESIKSEQTASREPVDMDRLDYSEYYNDDEQIDQRANNDMSWHGDDRDYNQNEDSTNAGSDLTKLTDDVHSESLVNTDINGFLENNNSELPGNENNDVNFIMNKVIEGLKNAFSDIKNFWFETSKELLQPNYTLRKKCELKERTQQAQTMIDNLCESINGIYCRECYEPQNNIHSLLKKDDINQANVAVDRINEYKNAIGNCLEQAKILQDSVAALAMAVRNKPTSVS